MPLDNENVTPSISEFFGESDFATLIDSQDSFALYFEGEAPADFGSQSLVFVHPSRMGIGMRFEPIDVELSAACQLSVSYSVQSLGESCATFTSYSRPAPMLLRTALVEPVGEPELIPAPGQPFDCEANGAGEFESCTEFDWCAPGLICAGITRFDTGMCMDASLHGVFETDLLELEFSDAQPVSDTLEVAGLASVDTDVIINVSLEHPDPSALNISLTNPSGNEVPVWEQEPSPYQAQWYAEPGSLRLSRIPVGFSGDEEVNGSWTLTITSSSDQPGTLHDWTLELMSRFD